MIRERGLDGEPALDVDTEDEDTETTGIETTFDRILQFAAFRTDDDLNELERST